MTYDRYLGKLQLLSYEETGSGRELEDSSMQRWSWVLKKQGLA